MWLHITVWDTIINVHTYPMFSFLGCTTQSVEWNDRTTEARTTNRMGHTPEEIRAARSQASKYQESDLDMKWELPSKPDTRYVLNIPIPNNMGWQGGISMREAERELRRFDETTKFSLTREVAMLRRSLTDHRTESDLNRERLKRMVQQMRTDFAAKMQARMEERQPQLPLCFDNIPSLSRSSLLNEIQRLSEILHDVSPVDTDRNCISCPVCASRTSEVVSPNQLPTWNKNIAATVHKQKEFDSTLGK